MIRRKIAIIGMALLLFGTWLTPAQALNTTPAANNGQPGNTNTAGANSNQPADHPKPILEFNKPINNTVSGLLQRAINILLGLIASVSVIFIMIGGFRLAFSQGKTEAIEAGKKTITWAIAGLVIALLAFAIVRIVLNILY